MAGRLRDTLSRRYRNRRQQHEQTRSARARGPPVRAGSLRTWRCDATAADRHRTVRQRDLDADHHSWLK